jgi:hypothetical protein
MAEAVRARTENGVLPRWTYGYPFDHRSQAALGPVRTWRGAQREYIRCCWKVFVSASFGLGSCMTWNTEYRMSKVKIVHQNLILPKIVEKMLGLQIKRPVF